MYACLRVLGAASIVLFVLTACSPGALPTEAPTLVLIPSTATPTATLIPPTPTVPDLPGPEDVFSTPQAAVTPIMDRALLDQAIADLVQTLSIAPEEVRVLRLDAAVWTNIDLGCGDGQLPPLELEIQGFRILLEAGDTVYEYHTDNRSKVRRCETRDQNAGTTVTLIETDPVAAELVALAQRRVAQMLDLPARRVRLVDLVPVTWEDNSLGCPLPGQSYVPVRVNGYRIVVAAGDETYIFHTDTESIAPCAAENERLPTELARTPDS